MVGRLLVLKENESCVVLDAEGGTAGATAAGIYRRDTRFISEWRWAVASAQVLQCGTHEDVLLQRLAVKHNQVVTAVLERRLTVRSDGFDEHWQVRSTASAPQEVRLDLHLQADGRDLFAALSEVARELLPPPGMARHYDSASRTLQLSRTASDGVVLSVALSAVSEDLSWTFVLAPGEQAELNLAVNVQSTDDCGQHAPLPPYAQWRSAVQGLLPQPRDQEVLDRAADDIRMLLLTTEHGIYPAAGMPHFVTIFGRDALLTSMMLLPFWPQVARDVLRFLAAYQGRQIDAFREEEPGKILHEMRRGELSRTARVPFGRYYGSVDSTPLFLMALDAYAKQTGDDTLVHELQPNWLLAADWLAQHQQGDDGLIAFAPSGSGLLVQSWKDSSESMVHADGSRAAPPLAVAEVQGYAYAAFLAVAGFHERLGDTARADEFRQRAARLAAVFERSFWLDDLGTYAMALDGQRRPLRVLSSDAGHLLWCGIVPPHRAARLVATLMTPALWSGWGLRTLGADEVAYNPVSYHNGSVWPHDTALFAAGLARYGFVDELAFVSRALFDLAASLPDMRLPELISGQARETGFGPVNYTHACRPQAWAAASIPFLVGLQSAAAASPTTSRSST